MRRGYCGIGVWHTKCEVNIGTLWRSATIFEADFIFTVGRRYSKQSSDTLKTWRHIPLFHFERMDDLQAHIPYDSQLVGVENAQGAISLDSFAHPERAVYLLGAEDHGLSPDVLGLCYATVQIPSPLTFCLNVATAGSIILYDRYTKGGLR